MRSGADSMTKGKATVWVLGTILAPLGITWLLVSLFIAGWYARTGHQGAPPTEPIQSAVMLMTAPGLWASVGLFWLIHRRSTSFAELFATRTAGLAKDLVWGLALGLVWAGR